jgi:hypothetical protein
MTLSIIEEYRVWLQILIEQNRFNYPYERTACVRLLLIIRQFLNRYYVGQREFSELLESFPEVSRLKAYRLNSSCVMREALFNYHNPIERILTLDKG